MRVMPLERIPPQSLEAEQSVLGSMLLERDAIAKVVEMLRGEDFYRDAHRRIFEAITDLFERGEPVDLITVTDRLRARGQLEDVGGAAYLTALLDAVPTAANVEYYARIVLQKALLRQLIHAGTEIVGLGYREEQDVEVLVDQAEKLVFAIANRRMQVDFVPIRDVLRESFDRIDRRYQDKGTVTGVPTGFTDLDRLTAGLQPADLVIVAARPGMGKCLKYDAEVVDPSTGALRTIQEIVGARQASLLTLDDTMHLTAAAPGAFVDDGIKPVFRVTTGSGRMVETTLTHPFLTPHGWRALHDLVPGTLIAVPRRLPVSGTLDLPAYEVCLLAYLTSGRLPLSPRLATDFTDALAAGEALLARPAPLPVPPVPPPAAVGPDPTAGAPRDGGAREQEEGPGRRPGVGSRRGAAAIAGGADAAAVVEVLYARYPTLRGEAGQRAVPPEVFLLRREKLALFLNRLLASAGTVTVEGEAVSLTAVLPSVRAARQVQHLLLRFGVPAAVSGTEVRVGPAAMPVLLREVGLLGQERLRRWARNQQRALLDDVDVMWDPIVAIEEVGSFQVYDLTVPGTHNFVANDVCVHNTTFCLNVAVEAAERAGPVAIFSLETSTEQLVQRLLCATARVDGSKLRTGFLSEADFQRIGRAIAELDDLPIFIDDSPGITAIEMRAKARKLMAEHGLSLVIIDYLQMIQSYRRTENRTQEMSEIARATKSLAKELNVPVIGISQLSRAVEMSADKRPQLSHLRETGELEQVADLVLFIYREDYYNEHTDRKNIAEIRVEKHRNGPTGKVELYFQKEFNRFEDLARRRGGPP
ncbi:MAG: replicative DNA helicase [Armatimonadota bacterium]|nr:replicative DNA helicase [Armatimonadota bacterium]